MGLRCGRGYLDTELKKYMNPRYIICALIDSYSINLHELVDWADTAINCIDSPMDWLFKISLATNLSDISYYIRCTLADENILDHDLIDSLFIGFVYIRYINDRISSSEFEKILSEYFVSDKKLFNEDTLFTYFHTSSSDDKLINEINQKFYEYEFISRQAFEYFYSSEIYKDLDL